MSFTMTFLHRSLICIYLLMPFYVTGNSLQCLVVKEDAYQNCSNHRLRWRYSELSKGRTSENNKNCTSKACHGNLQITVINGQLHRLSIFNQLVEMLESCCTHCVSFSVVKEVRRISAIDEAVLNSSDIILPVMSEPTQSSLYGFHFIPVLEAPEAYLLTLKRTRREKLLTFILGVLEICPLLLICFLFTFVSGFIIWLIEKRRNSLEFPTSFLKGMWEGFWWSFVSMTTVGYGDLIPRTCMGRMYSIFWIVIGITLFSVLTGVLTNQIRTIYTDEKQTIFGKKIGGIQHKKLDASIVAHYGGNYKEFHYNNNIIGYADLIKKLSHKEIEGVIITRPLYYFFSQFVKLRKFNKYYDEIKDVELEKTVFGLEERNMAIGFLVRNKKQYEYFKTYFKDNYRTIQNCNAFHFNSKTGGSKYSFGNSKDEKVPSVFHLALIGFAGIIVFILSFGLVYELRKKIPSKSLCSVKHTDL